MSEGVVYFVRSGKHIKIGTSTNFDSRIQAIETNSPFKAEVLAMIPGDRMLEQEIHSALLAYRTKLEWFRDCKEVRSFISEITQERGVIQFQERRNRKTFEPAPTPTKVKADRSLETIRSITKRFERLIDAPGDKSVTELRFLDHQFKMFCQVSDHVTGTFLTDDAGSRRTYIAVAEKLIHDTELELAA